MRAPTGRTSRLPALGLIAAAAALIGAPMAKYGLQQGGLVLGAHTGPHYRALAEDVDAFWRDRYDAQFPEARAGYFSPSVVFKDLDVDPDGWGDDIAGFYEDRFNKVTVDTDADLSYVALVVAHEFGHHVQLLSGWNAHWARERMFADWREADRLDVRYELQAECLAGVWAHFAVQSGVHLTRAELNQHRRDDLAAMDSETHGSAEQRYRWFESGFASGQAEECDTFAPSWARL